MKTLQESIIGKRGTPGIGNFSKSMLRSGDIIRYRGDKEEPEPGTLGMYIDYDDARRISRLRSVISQLKGEGGFFAFATINGIDLEWMPVNRYKENLTHKDSPLSKDLDIIEVWPMGAGAKPQILYYDDLEHLIKGKISIKINQ